MTWGRIQREVNVQPRTLPGPVVYTSTGKTKKELVTKINHAFAMALVLESLLQRGFFGRLKWLVLGK